MEATLQGKDSTSPVLVDLPCGFDPGRLRSGGSSKEACAISDSELECYVLEVADIIDRGEADDDDEVVRAVASCGFYGEFALRRFSDEVRPETLACVDESAPRPARKAVTDRADLRILMEGCGTAAEMVLLEEQFVLDDQMSESLDNIAVADASSLDFELGLVAGFGMELTDAEIECARMNFTDADAAASDEPLFPEIIEECVDDERLYIMSMTTALTALGQVELTEQDEECIRVRFAELDVTRKELIEAIEAEGSMMPVRCGTLGRFVAAVGDVSPVTAECIDAQAEDYVETLADRAGLEELLRSCATPAELESLGLAIG